jgi:two-component system, sensor histidine kinase and response regulator
MDIKGRILIIDDEEGVRKGCCRVLQPIGYAAETAASFQEGLQKIRENQYDLILLDVMMPDGQGIDLLEPILERDPDAVPVLITGYATVEMAVDAIKRGAYDFVSKPFTAQMLLMTVEQGLQKRHLSLETKRLQAVERQAVELAEAKEQAEKISEFKSAFATMVAHELRSPVGATQGLIRTLLRGMAGGLNEKQTELLKRVEIRLSELLVLIEDLLTLAASKSISVEKPLQAVRIDAVLQRLVERFTEEVQGKQVGLNYCPANLNLTVRATEDGLETVLSNLIGNAIKYTPAGGSIQVDATEQEGYCKLTVTDTGIGIPQEDLLHLGEEFFRAKNAYESHIPGTGLGLSIICELMKHFGGQINFQSQEGQGTTVLLKLPIWDG